MVGKNTICIWHDGKALDAMMEMGKIDIAAIEAARRG